MQKIMTVFFSVSVLLTACGHKGLDFNRGSVQPGTHISKKGLRLELAGTPLQTGQPFPDVILQDTLHSQAATPNMFQGKVVLLSIVPSLNTKVCEAQTHYLGDAGDSLPPNVVRITVSRDLYEDMSRFSKETGMDDVQFYSDRGMDTFGQATGLQVSGMDILARAVIILDKQGIVRYIQVVPELTTLPDMERAFRIARRLSRR